ncbi:hypothetical protein CCL41_gp51 [Sulfolobus islandicus rod-shaped virus 9]|uniref:Uncharacterized protein n=2 Tax=Usarudivirus TaxID=2843109 RepID=A0A1X9SJJ2_9VIRU|nr:hypothetical protein CCL41_gp51 [Sulfolobus islandicus rod-shaped virus 9]YP_009362828.1 hypothetical protein CCL34_gp44 [Sulfolobus islandicus rod-shaped virus 10]ARQ96399.1 hypothetical protein [Sulfolobus islandicus rod-shaped virus 9]ARQ96511.1 hypothetical protein [Sulfolobus islandicus rod-shaped virus 10]
MNKLKVQVSLKDEKYPFFEDKALDITEIGDRARGRVIYFSGRFVESGENGSFIEFDRVNEFTVKLANAKIVVTEKGTPIIKFEPGNTLYVIELPSGYRGGVYFKVLSGECEDFEILRSPRGSLGEVKHLYCNGDVEIQYSISGRVRTAGYGYLIQYFGENLSGKIVIKDGKVEVIYDEQLDKLLS